MSETCIKHIEEYWKIKTIMSNKLFKKNNLKKALSGYKEAMYRAEVLNSNHIDCVRSRVPFLQIFIISCNNLANTYEKMRKIKEAEDYLKRVIYYLLYAMRSKDFNKNEAQSELKKATLRYISFAEDNNINTNYDKNVFSEVKKQILEDATWAF